MTSFFPSQSLTNSQSINIEFQDSNDKPKNDLQTFVQNDDFSNESKGNNTEENLKTLQDKFEITHSSLLKKLDLCVALPIWLIFFIANVNRSNFSLLFLEGMGTHIDMTFTQYFAAVATFFTPYVVFQSFSNLILRYVRPHFWISASTLFYGAVLIGQGYINNYSQLIACEFLHGLFQAGTDTSMIFLLMSYYSQGEVQKRVGLIYSSSAFAVFFNNMIAYGLLMHYKGSQYEIWQLMLIINGSLTMFSAIVVFFLMPDFPEGNRFLQDYETLYIIKRLEILYGKSGYNTRFTPRDVLKTIIDPMVWVPAITSIFLGGVCYNITFLEPFFYYEFHGKTVGLIKSSWGWIGATGSVIIFGYICDFIGNTFWIVLLNLCCAMYGIIAFFKAEHTTEKLLDSGAYMFIIGLFTAYPLFQGLAVYNLNGHLRRSVGTSLIMAAFDVGGVYGTFMLKNDNTMFRKSSRGGVGLVAASVTLVSAYGALLYFKNKAKGKKEYIDRFEELSENQKIIEGDKNPRFIYQF